MEKILHTFFFGYLSLKWRRLFRTLIFLPYTLISIFFLMEVSGHFKNTLAILGLMISTALSVGLISWIIKPFVVKLEDKNKLKISDIYEIKRMMFVGSGFGFEDLDSDLKDEILNKVHIFVNDKIKEHKSSIFELPILDIKDSEWERIKEAFDIDYKKYWTASGNSPKFNLIGLDEFKKRYSNSTKLQDTYPINI
jgi:hypothetical protein